jgi:hypothetical protein
MSEGPKLTLGSRFVAITIAAGFTGWLFLCWDGNRNFSGRWEEPWIVWGTPTLLFAIILGRPIASSLRRGQTIDALSLTRAFIWAIANAICFFLLMASAAIAIFFVTTVLYDRMHLESWRISSMKITVFAVGIATLAYCGMAVIARRLLKS